jgi:plasmid stabilization system protein ParE
MARKVVLSPSAKAKLEDVLRYLEEEWSGKVKMDFISILDARIQQVSQYPKSCPESSGFSNLHRCVVTKQVSFFYRIMEDRIEVITFFDTRQDPGKLEII